jgi:hypothetical protein
MSSVCPQPKDRRHSSQDRFRKRRTALRLLRVCADGDLTPARLAAVAPAVYCADSVSSLVVKLFSP